MKNHVVPRVSRGQIEIIILAYVLSCQGVGIEARVILFLETVQDVCNEVCVRECVCVKDGKQKKQEKLTQNSFWFSFLSLSTSCDSLRYFSETKRKCADRGKLSLLNWNNIHIYWVQLYGVGLSGGPNMSLLFGFRKGLNSSSPPSIISMAHI